MANDVQIHVTNAGNEFMLDIARLLEDGFRSTGAKCRLAMDEVPDANPGSTLELIVAPHEFCTLFLAKKVDPSQLSRVLSGAHILNVEQPGSAWFETAWEFARISRGVFDVSREGVAEFRRRGINARHAPLGYAAMMEAPAIANHADRSVDVLFMGHDSSRRQAFFARHAAFFAKYHCRLVLVDVGRPRHLDTPGYYAGNERLALLASSKILLNVHSRDRSYFEAHRAMLGISNRCLLVTETSRFTDPLVVGRHFAMADLDELPQVCDAYLADPAELARVADEGHEFVTRQMTMASTCRAILDTAQDNGRQTRLTRADTDVRAERKAVLQRIAVSRKRPSDDNAVVYNAAYGSCASPGLSTIVTLYNYGRYIEECLRSVVQSDTVEGGHELVVVDDASTDDSAERVERLMHQVDFPIVIEKKTLNTGLAETRNLGLRRARGRHVFILDADNWVYPSGPRVLAEALSNGRYAAAYGLLRRFDDETGESLGLLSTYEWNPRDLVRSPYIDAMAMFDRQTVLEFGGYATELIEHGWFGWEDYDLWLTLAQASRPCVLVPRIVGAYRVHGSSMLHRTNQSTDGIRRHFRRKFKPLMDRYPGLECYFGYPEPGGAERQPSRQINEVDELRAELERVGHELRAVYASGSWRVTAPLRFALRLITGRP